MSKTLIAKGKTKRVRQDLSALPLGSISRCKDIVSWRNKNKKPLKGKGALCAQTTSAVFEYIMANTDVPVAYRGRGKRKDEFLGLNTTMLPLEVIYRQRNEEGSSFAGRNPSAPLGKLEKPLNEFFLKTDGTNFKGIIVPDNDPFIGHWDDTGIWVYAPGVPKVGTGTFVPVELLGLPDGHSLIAVFNQLAHHTHTVGDALVAGFAEIGWTLGDFKIEFGYIVFDGVARIFLSDELNNDSWRIQDSEGIERSKQRVRNTDSLDGMLECYEMVAAACERLLLLGR